MAKKVGLAVVVYKNNYGSMLQSYATQKIISLLGYEPEIIRIDGIDKEVKAAKIKFFIKRLLNADERKYIYSMIRSIFMKRISKDFKSKSFVRDKKYQSFSQTWFKYSKRCNSRTELSDMCKTYKAVIVGSDQLWRPSNIEADIFTLSFVPPQVKKIAYSTSFGVAVLPEKQRTKASAFLNRFQFISVREETGRELVHQLTGLYVPVVCDPSMLLDCDQWLEIQNETPIIPEPYILCYFLGDNELCRTFTHRLRNETGYKIVGLLHGATYIQGDDTFPDEALYDVGPSEFLNLVRNSSFVCTDSFHGTIFSILFKKKFFAFRRFEDESELSTNDRLRTLFSWTGLQDRMIHGDENVKQCISMVIDYDTVFNKVSEKRQQSINYLINALAYK